MQERPIAFFSHALQGQHLMLSTYGKEKLALVWLSRNGAIIYWDSSLLCELIERALDIYGPSGYTQMLNKGGFIN